MAKSSTRTGPEPRWYVIVGDRWIGPLSKGEIKENLIENKISPVHFACRPDEKVWKRLSEIEDLAEVLIEATRTVHSRPGVRHWASPGSEKAQLTSFESKYEIPKDKRIWFLYMDGSQFGPYSFAELEKLLIAKKVNRNSYAWTEGMETWEKLRVIEDLKELIQKFDSQQENLQREKEARKTPRRPLLAHLVLTHEESVLVAVCHDISIGGMQILADRVPGSVGSKIRITVRPSGRVEGGNIPPFSADAVITRVAEDGRNFSVKFQQLPEHAKRAIETHIASES